MDSETSHSCVRFCYVAKRACIVCHASVELSQHHEPEGWWSTVLLGDDYYWRCPDCTAADRTPQ